MSIAAELADALASGCGASKRWRANVRRASRTASTVAVRFEIEAAVTRLDPRARGSHHQAARQYRALGQLCKVAAHAPTIIARELLLEAHARAVESAVNLPPPIEA